MGKLVFVTSELFPFTRGGIGRAIYNMVKSLDFDEKDRVTIVLVGNFPDHAALHREFPDLEIVVAHPGNETGRHDGAAHAPPGWAYSDTEWHWLSYVALRELKELSKRSEIDYVEFPDWGGLGFCTIQEKKTKGFLADATLSVRLHGPHLAIINTQQYPVEITDLNICDIERKCLSDCDVILSQTEPYGEYVKKISGFSDIEWNGRVINSPLPVILDSSFPPCQVEGNNRPILFTSKFQHVKRPDVFVRGVSRFFREHTHLKDAYFLAFSDDADAYTKKVTRAIPSDLCGRFHFAPEIQGYDRNRMISQSIVVVASTCESFCLAAYEAVLLGAIVILNGSNPSFSEQTFWQDGVNCYKFDGSPQDLNTALARATAAPVYSLQRVTKLPPFIPAWKARKLPKKAWAPIKKQPLVSIIVPYYNVGKVFFETLKSISEADYDNIELIVVNDASTDSKARQIIADLEMQKNASLKVVTLKGNVGLPGARNVALDHATGSYILPLDADDLIHPDFIKICVEALENNKDAHAVTSHAGFFRDGSPAPQVFGRQDCVDYAVFFGEAVISGLSQNRFSSATAIFRRTVFDSLRYDENLSMYEDWSLYMRMVAKSMRIFVLNEVYFYYRTRNDSMIHSPRSVAEKAQDYQNMLRSSAPPNLMNKSQYLNLCSFDHLFHKYNGAAQEVRQLREELYRARGEETIRQTENAQLQNESEVLGYRQQIELLSQELDSLRWERKDLLASLERLNTVERQLTASRVLKVARFLGRVSGYSRRGDQIAP